MKDCALTRQRFNKLATIYRLCAALEVEMADVLPSISGMCDKSHPDMVTSQDKKPSDESMEELKEFFADVNEGNKV